MIATYGYVTGLEYIDLLTLPDSENTEVYDQSIGVATLHDGFSGVDGILGYVKTTPRYHVSLIELTT